MRFAALVRGVNVGGNKLVRMEDLRGVAERTGLEAAKTVMQSGNLLFQSSRRSTTWIENALECEASVRLRLEIKFLVRSANEWNQIVSRNVFEEEAKSKPGQLIMMCLKTAVSHELISSLRERVIGRETIYASGRELYIVYPDGVGRSKLTHGLIEKRLGTLATGRNWNTVLKLAALLQD